MVGISVNSVNGSKIPTSGIRADGSVGDVLSEVQSSVRSRWQPKGVTGGVSSRKFLDGGAGQKLKENLVDGALDRWSDLLTRWSGLGKNLVQKWSLLQETIM